MAYSDAALLTPAREGISSRWKYRVWLDKAPVALDGEWTCEELVTDTYFVSPLTRWQLKIANGTHLELSINTQTRDGLENWTTQVSEAFPLTPSLVHSATSLHLSDYVCQSADRLETFVDLCTNFRVVKVKKRAQLTTMGSALVKWTEADIDGTPSYCCALESSSFEELKRVVELTGLSGQKNCDYSSFLRSLGH